MPSVATNRSVYLDELLAFVRPRHRLLLGTWKRGGSLQLSPVTAGVDDGGRIVVATYPSRAKVANLRRNSRATALVLSDEWNGPWVQIDGTGEVLDLPDALEPLVDYFRVISGEHSDWDEYRSAMQRQGKCLIRLTPESWGPVATGGFPPGLQPS